MKTYILILILLSLLTSCGIFKRDYPEIAHAITLKTAKELYDEKGMSLQGTGGGMIGNVNHFDLMLTYSPPLSRDKGRKLFIEVLDKYLSNINNNMNIRPFLNNYPYQAKDITLYISFYSPNGARVPPGELDYIVISNGIMRFKTKDKEGRCILTLFEETLEEARQKVQEYDSRKNKT